VRSGQGEARTILLLHIISVRPSKQPLMVRTFFKVYMELGSYFLFLQEQIKDIIINSLAKQLSDKHKHVNDKTKYFFTCKDVNGSSAGLLA
jgi:GTPase involved in cell partitioning and DNA repair